MVENYKKEPLVSIIIPTYNREDLLPRAIKSCINQTYKNLEIIIVNDGSTDNTEEVVKNFKDERIIYVKNEKNKGIPQSRNTGLKIAKGDFIEFLDHDDEFLSEKTEKQVKVLIDNPDIDFTSCERYEYDINTKQTSLIPEIFLQQILIRKTDFEKIGMFDERFWTQDDKDIQMRFKQFHLKSIYINQPLIMRYSHKDSTSLTISAEKSIHDKMLIWTKHKNILKKREISNIFYSIGKDYIKIKQFKSADIWFFKSFFIYPINLQPLLKILGFVIHGIIIQSFYKKRKQIRFPK